MTKRNLEGYKKELNDEHNKIARYYDKICARAFDTRFFDGYASKTGGPILELACGTGRILTSIAKLGFEVVGLDLSSDMLEVFREKISKDKDLANRVELVCGDMESFDLKRKFNLIFISNSSFLLVESDSGKLNVLNCMARHLSDDGLCIIDNYPYRESFSTELTELEYKEVPKVLLKVDALERNRFRDTFHAIVIENGQEKEVEYVLNNWYLNKEQMTSLIRKSQLKLEKFLSPKESEQYFSIDIREVFILKKK